MKKLFLAATIILSSGIALYAFSKKEETSAQRPCKKHIDQCPSGYSGGYHCSWGTPIMENCAPNECDEIIPCSPDA